MNSNSRLAASPDGKSLIMDIDMDEEHNRNNWDGPPPSLWLLEFNGGKATRLTERGFFAWHPSRLNTSEFLFASQGPNDNTPAIYGGSNKNGGQTLLIKNACTPSASSMR